LSAVARRAKAEAQRAKAGYGWPSCGTAQLKYRKQPHAK
jgi:hypothetical protein